MKNKGGKIISYGLIAAVFGYIVAKMGTNLLINMIANLVFILGSIAIIAGLVIWITGSIHEKKEHKR